MIAAAPILFRIEDGDGVLAVGASLLVPLFDHSPAPFCHFHVFIVAPFGLLLVRCIAIQPANENVQVEYRLGRKDFHDVIQAVGDDDVRADRVSGKEAGDGCFRFSCCQGEVDVILAVILTLRVICSIVYIVLGLVEDVADEMVRVSRRRALQVEHGLPPHQCHAFKVVLLLVFHDLRVGIAALFHQHQRFAADELHLTTEVQRPHGGFDIAGCHATSVSELERRNATLHWLHPVKDACVDEHDGATFGFLGVELAQHLQGPFAKQLGGLKVVKMRCHHQRYPSNGRGRIWSDTRLEHPTKVLNDAHGHHFRLHEIELSRKLEQRLRDGGIFHAR
mmetsp:Transcript_11007/g.31600  ORF Transcript_11007/g.31600 Transcript_11007/m.31600 type:complete len:335 (-) Transcript_11007:2640-3644(-)